LAAALEYSKPTKVRELIKRHLSSLEQFGTLPTVGKTHENNGLGGSPATEFYLNKQQAIFITTQSKTTKAIDITIELVKRFDAYERGLISNQKPDSSVALEFAKLVMEHLPNLGDRSKQAVLSETSLLVFGTRTVPAPVVDEQFWTTTEIAKECGVTPQKAGRVANSHSIKHAVFGEYRLSKSLHSDK
jgi:phage regulator Rha-like protein